jgi:flagellar hook protein FlgE
MTTIATHANTLLGTPAQASAGKAADVAGPSSFRTLLGQESGGANCSKLSDDLLNGIETDVQATGNVSLGANLNSNQAIYAGAAYSATNPSNNMAGGTVAPDYSQQVAIYDALGNEHTLAIDYLKTGANSWSVEIVAQPPEDVKGSSADGQLAAGTITFNADGSLKSVSPSLTTLKNIEWTDGSKASTIAVNYGSPGETNGLTQDDSFYVTNFITQDGAPLGELTGITVDGDGDLVAAYSNGETKTLLTLPEDRGNTAENLPAAGRSYAFNVNLAKEFEF